MSSNRYNLRPRKLPDKTAKQKKGDASASAPNLHGKTLSPILPISSLKPKTAVLAPSATPTSYPVGSSFGQKSTGAHYLRAAQRDERRVASGKIGKPRHQFEKTARQARKEWREGPKALKTIQTPYGPANLSKFPTNDPGPRVTTLKKNYRNSTVGHKYTELTGALVSPSLKGIAKKQREKEVATELLEAINTGVAPPAKRRKIAEGPESNAASKFIAISHVSEPERVRGSSKDVRAVLRGVKKGKRSFEEAFEKFGNEPPRYLVAKDPTAARRALGVGNFKKPHPPSSFDAVDSDYSDSSDDDK